MPPRQGEPLRKVTLNLYEADYLKLAHDLGEGWSVWLRELVHEKLRDEPEVEQVDVEYEPFTVGEANE